ncbi:MAG: amino acid adenylation domain-containing protein, partial [Acidobacteria bacterium]|nr:amino acid adenylation domain-containing protein [Acidobacteriota bacterium]
AWMDGEVARNVSLTYHQLNEQANRLAGVLMEKGVLPDTIVAIMIERSVEMIVGILGIIKSGGAYLPIEKGYPAERIDYMLKDSNAKLTINYEFLKDAPQAPFHQHSAFITQHSNHLCYVIYTSGSTGKPKGVMVRHENLVNATLGWREEYKLDKMDVNLLQMAGFSFDVSCGDLCRALMNGGKLVICPDEVKLNFSLLYNYLCWHQITLFESTPSLVIPFMDYIYENQLPLDYLKLLIIGSDSFRITDYHKLISRYGKSLRIINSYGATEATIDSTYYECKNEDEISTLSALSPFVPIGKPMPNVKCFILDRYGEIQPVGVPGELIISGWGIARGYANRPELTADRFYRSYWSNKAYILYKTGDLARWLPEGNIEFLGRIDYQVKIRGFRIETGEIEKQLSGHPGIRESIGKIDRKSLPKPGVKEKQDYLPPSNETEAKLAELWAGVLNIPSHVIGIDSNFFQLGGHSLKATILLSRIHKEFDVKVPLVEIFKTPRIKELAEYIKKKNKEIYQTIEPVEAKEYYPLSPAQKRLYVLHQLVTDNTSYNMPYLISLEQDIEKKKLELIFKKLTVLQNHSI